MGFPRAHRLRNGPIANRTTKTHGARMTEPTPGVGRTQALLAHRGEGGFPTPVVCVHHTSLLLSPRNPKQGMGDPCLHGPFAAPWMRVLWPGNAGKSSKLLVVRALSESGHGPKGTVGSREGHLQRAAPGATIEHFEALRCSGGTKQKVLQPSAVGGRGGGGKWGRLGTGCPWEDGGGGGGPRWSENTPPKHGAGRGGHKSR